MSRIRLIGEPMVRLTSKPNPFFRFTVRVFSCWYCSLFLIACGNPMRADRFGLEDPPSSGSLSTKMTCSVESLDRFMYYPDQYHKEMTQEVADIRHLEDGSLLAAGVGWYP